ncbi:hypothetical protein SH661x_002880 [Planctomicrobium sp. SH661]|uniref:hypothetical protein n=1 Tax=Planctomicrobium sp. SH661 TaxID=3448124 RepID=UPI003F5C06EB
MAKNRSAGSLPCNMIGMGSADPQNGPGPTPGGGDAQSTESPPAPPSTPEEVLANLVLRARLGDVSALPALRVALDHNPHLWNKEGDMAIISHAAWIELIAGHDLMRKEQVRRGLNALKVSLSMEADSPLEYLLIEQVISTWLQVHYLARTEATSPGGHRKWEEFRLKRLNAAFNHHERAIKALAAMQMMRPRLRAQAALLSATATPQKADPSEAVLSNSPPASVPVDSAGETYESRTRNRLRAIHGAAVTN